MIIRTFPGGVHPPSRKRPASSQPIKTAPVPASVIIPLIQHAGAPCAPKVKAGDYVKRGQVIAETEAFITSPIHASISGVVKELKAFPHPVLGECGAILIEGDGKDLSDEAISPRKDADSLKREEILDIIKRSGVVGLGGAAFPTHVKLAPPKDKTIDTVLLNGAECEPYLNCDYRLMLEKTGEILKGLAVIMKVLSVKKAFIAIEDNKPDAISAMQAALNKNEIRDTRCEIRTIALKTKYPQGGEKQLIKAVLGKEIPPGKLPFEVGCVVSNVGTAYAVYEAVYYNKPLYERVVTFSGSSIGESRNLLVRIGTRVSDLVDACGGFKEEVNKILFGGPMMGIAQYTRDVPVIKGTSGVLFLTEKEAKSGYEYPCIRCARCLDVCPMNLMPTRIFQYAKKERWEDAETLHPVDCMECGACAYECPSKIPLVHYIKLVKARLIKNK